MALAGGEKNVVDLTPFQTVKRAMDVLVLGSGVIGLSSAIRLLEAGHRVRLWTKAPPPETTSAVAAAIWYPYKAYPEGKVKEWGAKTLNELVRLSADPSTGIRVRRGKKVFHRPMGDPWWRDLVPDFRRLTREELGEHKAGYSFSVPVADMSIYLCRYLRERFAAAGGEYVRREAKNMDEALAECPTVVNCTGLGSRELAHDGELFPIRGQVVRVEGLKAEAFYMDSDHPAGMIYIIPRVHDAVLGGVAEDNAWDLTADRATAQAILARCREALPALAQARIVAHPVGLRPGRGAIRLEAERRAGGTVVHNYGHGGSGLTLSWGCADEVVDSVGRLV